MLQLPKISGLGALISADGKRVVLLSSCCVIACVRNYQVAFAEVNLL